MVLVADEVKDPRQTRTSIWMILLEQLPVALCSFCCKQLNEKIFSSLLAPLFRFSVVQFFSPTPTNLISTL